MLSHRLTRDNWTAGEGCQVSSLIISPRASVAQGNELGAPVPGSSLTEGHPSSSAGGPSLPGRQEISLSDEVFGLGTFPPSGSYRAPGVLRHRDKETGGSQGC